MRQVPRFASEYRVRPWLIISANWDNERGTLGLTRAFCLEWDVRRVDNLAIIIMCLYCKAGDFTYF